jgi:hypothetical protein
MLLRFSLAAGALLAAGFGASAPAAAEDAAEPISTPRRLIPNFDVLNLVPVLDELGVTHELRTSEDGKPFLAASFADGFTFNLAPTACLSSDFSRCIGVHIVAYFAASDINPQTLSAFNQNNEFASVGVYVRNESVFLLRYEIADYGIPRGNFASSLAQFVAVANRLSSELASRPKTVSLQGFSDDFSARALNRGGLAAIGAVGAAARHPHDEGLVEAAGLADALFRSGAPVNAVVARKE